MIIKGSRTADGRGFSSADTRTTGIAMKGV